MAEVSTLSPLAAAADTSGRAYWLLPLAGVMLALRSARRRSKRTERSTHAE